MELVVKHGADPAATGIHGWTALSDALVKGNADLIDYLVEKSDPRKLTHAVTRTSASYDPYLLRTPGYPWFPRSNALFLARHFGNPGVEKLEERLLNRAEALGGIAGRQISELKARYSAVRLTSRQSGTQATLESLEQALSDIELSTLTPESSSDYVTQVMVMLTDLHELNLMAGKAFDGEFREMADHITSIGGWKQGTHDMLDVLHAAKEGDPTDALSEWKSLHGKPDFGGWNFALLHDWIEEQTDTNVQARLHDTLDFFELPKFRSK